MVPKQAGVNLANLVQVPMIGKLQIPNILVTNLRSALPKLDDLAVTMKLHQVDLACITESWCHGGMTDSMLDIPGYKLLRRDRNDGRVGGGLLAYVHPVWTAECGPTFTRITWKLWFIFTVRSPRMPRQFSHITIGLVYHPPNTDHSSMVKHILRTMNIIRLQHLHSSFMITGDFNHLPEECLRVNAQMIKLVKAPTRGAAILDKLLTDMQAIYTETLVCTPVSRTDHNVVLCWPKFGRGLDIGKK